MNNMAKMFENMVIPKLTSEDIRGAIASLGAYDFSKVFGQMGGRFIDSVSLQRSDEKCISEKM